MSHLKFLLRHFAFFLSVNLMKCSIDGVSYIYAHNRRPIPSMYPRGEDPCNPLYWYPRNIPEYCNYKNFPIPEKPAPPLPMPMPVAIAQPNFIMPIPAFTAAFPGFAPFPFGVQPPSNNPILPVASPLPNYPYAPNPYPNNPQQIGMVPGLPGLVTKDNGINILPFSDAYSDLIEKHKSQMIRQRLEKLIQEYEDFPNDRSYRRLRKYARRNM